MPAKIIKIIKRGSISIEAFEDVRDQKTANLKAFCGIGGGSTVTYIESDLKIIVDTGFDFEGNMSEENVRRNNEILLRALLDFGLKPEDIDIVFITHWHFDHFGNINLFKKSKILVSSPTFEQLKTHKINCINSERIVSAGDGENIADGVKVMYTPGHTKGHTSLVVETENLKLIQYAGAGGMIRGIGPAKIIVAGDAVVSYSYYLKNTVWNYNADFFSMESALESMKKIRQEAEYINLGMEIYSKIFKNCR